MRDMPEALKLADLGETLLNVGSADALWDAHVGATLIAVPGTEPDRDTAARDVEHWHTRGWGVYTVLDEQYPDRVRAARRPPAVLMTQGSLVADDYGVAIVGSRKASTAALASPPTSRAAWSITRSRWCPASPKASTRRR